MIIGNAFKNLFKDLKVDVVNNGVAVPQFNVNYHWGDQKELLYWIKDKDNKQSVKYPLIWYVLNDYTEKNGFYDTNVTLVILQNNDDISQLNTAREANSYVGIIDPVWKSVKNKIQTCKYIDVFFDKPQNEFTYTDEPNYGVDKNYPDYKNNDFAVKSSKAIQNIVTDVVDARFIYFKMRINVNCIK